MFNANVNRCSSMNAQQCRAMVLYWMWIIDSRTLMLEGNLNFGMMWDAESGKPHRSAK